MKEKNLQSVQYLLDKHTVQIVTWYIGQLQERLHMILYLQEEESRRLRYHRGIMDLREQLDRCSREFSYFLQDNETLLDDFLAYIRKCEWTEPLEKEGGEVNGQGVSGRRSNDLERVRDRTGDRRSSKQGSSGKKRGVHRKRR